LARDGSKPVVKPAHIMTRTFFLYSIMILALGFAGGYGAALLGLPMPFLLGSLLTVTAFSLIFRDRVPQGYAFPQPVRLGFMVVIGVMIGAQVTPALFAQAGPMLAAFAALTVFVPVALFGNAWLFRRAGYDPATAFFCSAPGGLMESIAMAEDHKADLPTVITQQFLRIVVVIVALPVGLSIWIGHPVGSAAGFMLTRGAVDWPMAGLALVAGAAGSWIGHRINLPAAVLTGPLIAAAVISLTGLFPFTLPQWLVNDAQVVVGAALGTRFTGMAGRKLARAVGLAAVSVTGMLVFGAALALALVPLTGLGFDVLFVGLAPGGVSEMALIALSLAANPALVTAMHIYRIILTVAVLIFAVKRGVLPPTDADPANDGV
jgi:hypothetical protein